MQPPLQTDKVGYMERYDGVIDFVLDKVINDVRLYTHIPEDENLPASINQTIVMLASNLINSFGLINDDEANADDEVKEISEGDTRVVYSDRASRLQMALSTSSISGDFRGILNSVRRLPE
ncbi:hypothetical protein [Lactococcus lactis]|uniref:Uncharacterized protein n=2 Tax=Lactococcus lactis TaxID=1358 RepID=A0A6M0M835_9LACT|nr:hypothetical protein [Lactococcus lactis]NEX52802.1 hypothetical protein [Lactococcus lactis]NEX55405.1 hypothetical protein [Lactococcus lactis]